MVPYQKTLGVLLHNTPKDISTNLGSDMGKLHSSFQVASWDSAIIIKVRGFATQNNSVFFKDFLDEMQRKKFSKFIVDLSDCKGMDSTFMGVLASLAQPINKLAENILIPPLTVVNITSYHRHLFDTLGLLHVIPIGQIDLPDISMKELTETRYNPMERIKLIQEAHEYLVSLNENNKKQFGKFLEMLALEMQSLK